MMSIGSVGNYYKATYDYQKAQTKTAEAKAEETAASSAKEDAFVKSAPYKPDLEKVNTMKADLANNVSAFRQMVQAMFQKQGGMAGSAMNALLQIDKETQAKAQAAISEDGEWGIDKTAARILDFAKALSGGDPAKIDMLKDAVEKGFKAAEKIWGGKLPDICYKTLDKIMEGFKEWEGSSKAPESASGE